MSAAISPVKSPVKAWILAARPRTLTAAVTPVLIGTALAHARSMSLRWDLFACALLGAIFIQIGTNFVNDAMDFKKGTDKATERLGPLRVAAAGLIDADAVMRGAYLCFVIAALLGIPLIIAGGWPLLAIGLASIAAAYAYTGGPYPLAYHGLGDIFVIVFFGLIAVGGTSFLQTQRFDVPVAMAGLSTGFLAAVLLAVNNLRDIEGDRKNGKRTLPARFGVPFARVQILTLVALPFLMGFYWVSEGKWLAGVLPLLAIPVAIRLVKIVFTRSGRELNAGLAKAAALHALHGLLFALGLWFT